MNEEEKLKALVGRLMETIQKTIQNSPEVLKILKDIENTGFSLNFSMLLGIFIRNSEGMDMFFSSMGDEDSPEAQHLIDSIRELQATQSKKGETGESESSAIPQKAEWTEKDLQFLKSIGIQIDPSA